MSDTSIYLKPSGDGGRTPAVSVIVPFYNVAPYIGRCVESLMRQTLRDVEFIFVNDCTPDDSESIIREVAGRYHREIIILRHPNNRGLPASRNTGLEVARGAFIYHCDSDDYLDPNALKILYDTAMKEGAQMVCCDFFLEYGNSRRYMMSPKYFSPEHAIKYGFLAGKMKYNVWNKLVHRSLYEQTGIRFPEGHSMGEDMTIIRLAVLARRIDSVPVALYHWMKDNSGAFSFNYTPRNLEDLQYNAEETILYLRYFWNVPDKERFLAYFKLGIKLPFLMSGRKDQYLLWREWYPEANAFIAGNTFLPWRTRGVQLLAKWGLWPLVKLYALAVNRIVYKQRS